MAIGIGIGMFPHSSWSRRYSIASFSLEHHCTDDNYRTENIYYKKVILYIRTVNGPWVLQW